MNRTILSATIALALLTTGVSRGSDWLSTLEPSGSSEVMELADRPPKCDEVGANCGDIPDGSGGTVNCGTCPPPDICGGSGIPNVCGCIPQTCAGRCGSFDPGCGRPPLDCGQCASPNTCGGGGTPNVCGCTPRTCAGRNCDSIDPGCGLPTLNCGQCTGTAICTSSGVCCTPRTSCDGRSCGVIDRLCGLGTMVCGCSPGSICASGFCCTPRGCEDRCGRASDGCGGTLTCRNCGPKSFCDTNNRCKPVGGGFITKPPREDPDFCAAQGKNCGVIDDGQGGQVNCGTCKGKDTCGGGGVPNVCGRPPKK